MSIFSIAATFETALAGFIICVIVMAIAHFRDKWRKKKERDGQKKEQGQARERERQELERKHEEYQRQDRVDAERWRAYQRDRSDRDGDEDEGTRP